MSDRDPALLFEDFDRGRISRRELLTALGLAVAVRPAAAFAQGQCGGARAGLPECDPTPAKLPFESTGWKTVLLDHLSCQVADYPKEAAYYQTLINWKIRSDDGKQATLDIGDRSEEHTPELQSHSFISYAVFCLKKTQEPTTRKKTNTHINRIHKSTPGQIA